MNCPNCNYKNDEDAKFCISCGASFQKNYIDYWKEKIFQKKNKKYLKLFIGIILILGFVWIAYETMCQVYGPKALAKQYMNAMLEKDCQTLYSFSGQKDDQFLTYDNFRQVCEREMDENEIINYKIEDVDDDDLHEALSTVVFVNYTTKNTNNEQVMRLQFSKKPTKKWHIIPEWEINTNRFTILKNVSLVVPHETKIKLNGILLQNANENPYRNKDMYTISAIYKGTYTLEITLKSNEVLERQIQIMDDSEKNLADMTAFLNDTDKEEMSKTLEANINELIKGVFSNRAFENVEVPLHTKNLSKAYNSSLKEYNNLKYFISSAQVKEFKLSYFRSEDEEVLASVSFTLSYTRINKETLEEEKQTKVIPLEATFIYQNNQFLLEDIEK